MRKIKYENLKRDATGRLWDSGFAEDEIAKVLRISVTNVIRFKAELERLRK